tara:strand:- start:440 stop:1399 length:960 start_codon:yes stop_codon:yes gene_type:complete
MSIFLTLSDEASDDSWKTSIPKYNGLGTEGIGSVFQYQILLSFYADFIGIDFIFPGSENLSHHSYTEYSEKEFHQNIDSFFNFPKMNNNWDEVFMFAELQSTNDPRGAQIFNGELVSFIEKNKDTEKNILINLHWCHLYLLKFCQQNESEIFTKERIESIRDNLIFTGKKYFDGNINISLHLRTANPNDIPSEIVSPLRELYIMERDFYRYKNLIDYLKEQAKGQKATLHIHSQGFKNNFDEFLELIDDNFDIQLHIDDNPLSDIYHMSNADLLIISNSSFSWLPSLLNSNQKIARDNFTNGPFVHNCLKANYDFTQIL